VPGRVVVATVASALLCVALAVAAGTGAASSSPTCDPSLGDELERRLPVSNFDKRIGQTLCFDFTGDGREDIVFTGWLYANRGAHYWAAFRVRGDGWSKVTFKRDCCTVRRASGIKVRRAGRVLVVSQPIYKASDKACCPTGGTRTGRWRWAGTQLKLIGTTTKPEAASTPRRPRTPRRAR
jgi:hypothetical protein